MKKLLLSLAFLPLFGQAMVPVTPNQPEGTLKHYFLKSNYYNTQSGSINWTKSLVGDVVWSADGKTVWFKNLFPFFGAGEFWTKGEVNGHIVTIPQQVVLKDYDDNGTPRDLSISAIEFDLIQDVVNDAAPSFGMTVETDGSITCEKGDNFYISLCELDEAGQVTITTIPPLEEGGDPTYTPNVYDLMQEYEYTPLVASDTIKVKPTSTTVINDYLCRYTNQYGGKKTRKAKIGTAGTMAVYVSGLCEDETVWVKGTRTEDTITLPSDQYTGILGSYYSSFVGVSKLNISGLEYYAIDDNFTLTKGENGSWVGQAMCGQLAVMGIDLLALNSEVTLTPYNGETVGTPAKPYNLWLKNDELETDGCYSFGFTCENIGTQGEYLEEKDLFYRFYLDGEVYEFDPATYPKDGPFENNLIPYTYSGFDIIHDARTNETAIYFYEGLWDVAGVQAVYVHDGKEYASDIATIDFSVLGVNGVKSAKRSKSGVYDLQGRQLNAPAKGLNIVDGKKYLIK